ncbi:unnamed protein product [Gongylonema pulchrum]|uniref:Reverse transcriptase domain-containing protein n=1 Tax=Gongylonema pulchrum TaxID=637853 RepID=A0A183EPF6_9BILA|nr:unnamed protein product [Gongylonema pulchrum]
MVLDIREIMQLIAGLHKCCGHEWQIDTAKIDGRIGGDGCGPALTYITTELQHQRYQQTSLNDYATASVAHHT